jgi:hypothetical protein
MGKYRAGQVPVLVGAAKCAKKGHRPPSKTGWCTRCGTTLRPPAAPVEMVPLPPDPAAEAFAAIERANRQSIADAFRIPVR